MGPLYNKHKRNSGRDLMQQIEEKMRIIQESVPGKQVTLAHLIANPDKVVYKKLGLNPHIDYHKSSIGILTMTPSETAIIAGTWLQNSQCGPGLHRPIQWKPHHHR